MSIRQNKETDNKDSRRKIVIMGATSGIGLRCAIILALAGWHVGVAGRNIEVLKKLKKRFPKAIEYERIDITSADAPRSLMKLIERLGGMEVYFHVSGAFSENPDLEISKEAEVLQTNVVGFAQMTATAYKYFKETGQKGQIAAITSVAGTRGIGALAAYSASKKFDQTYLTALEQLAHIQGVNVRFTDIRPGWIRTPLENADRNYPMNMDPEYAVPLILQAMLQRRRVAVIDWRWNLLYRVWRLIPNALWTKLKPEISTPANEEETEHNKAIAASEI